MDDKPKNVPTLQIIACVTIAYVTATICELLACSAPIAAKKWKVPIKPGAEGNNVERVAASMLNVEPSKALLGPAK